MKPRHADEPALVGLVHCSAHERLAVSGFTTLALGIAGCPALIVASTVGSLGYAGYEYETTGPVPGMPSQSQPNAKPTPSLNDIE
jgi:hypothetical protein